MGYPRGMPAGGYKRTTPWLPRSAHQAETEVATMPTAPPSRCTDTTCRALATNRGRCDEHQPPPWRSRPSWKQRYGMSVSQWRKLRDRILKRDEHRCYICGGEGADEVDHIIPVFEGGSQADPGNLAAIHDDPCHQAKSKGEAARANARRKIRS